MTETCPEHNTRRLARAVLWMLLLLCVCGERVMLITLEIRVQ